MTPPSIRVTVWNEGVHEAISPQIREIYPDGIHGAIIAGVHALLEHATLRGVTLADPDQGLPQHLLESTDVLIWWGHIAHDDVSDDLVDRIHARVLGGMGLIVLHSAHFSKIFTALMGTTCSLRWRNDGERELVWTVDPTHAIARGVEHPIVIERQEMYGEFFDIPAPDELVFVSSFAGGEVFRSGVTYRRGRGKVFYFSPGDQDFPVYHQPAIHRVLANAIQWAAPALQVGAAPEAFRADLVDRR